MTPSPFPTRLPRLASAVLSLAVLCGGTTACNKGGEAPRKEPPAPSASAVPTASAAAPEQLAQPAVPTLVPQPIEATKGLSYYPIEGAHIVVQGLRVGRLVDDKVEWIGTVPETNQALGGTTIYDVYGKWPDVDVKY